jgi:CRISPR-associated protein Csx14
MEFKIACGGTLREMLAVLVMDSPTVIERLEFNGLGVAPIIAPLAFSFDGGATTGLILDAWTRIALVKGVAQVISNPPWNFWSGQQTTIRLWTGLRAKLVSQVEQLTSDKFTELFSPGLLQKGRFGFDAGPAWNAWDAGFSPNEHKMEVQSSPATELLGAIGLQRFRPVMNDGRDGFDYFSWHNPYPPPVAAAAMVGAIRDHRTRGYRAAVIHRGEYDALGFAYVLNKGDNDD